MTKYVSQFSYDAPGPGYPKKQAKYFKNQVGRQQDPLPPDYFADKYPDTMIERTHRGDLNITCYDPETAAGEYWQWTGNHRIEYDDGSVATGTTGTNVTKNTQGSISTTQYSGDSATYNHSRQVIGNLDNQQELMKGGGAYSEVGGHKVKFCGGMETQATCMASGKSSHNIGKQTINAEGGIGLGVNKGSSMKIFQRMEPDGTWHVQVTPAGQEGGKMTLKVNPDGTILVTSEKSATFEIKGDINMKTDAQMNIDAKAGMTIKSPTLSLKGQSGGSLQIKHKGNYKQAGTHKDSRGVHPS